MNESRKLQSVFIIVMALLTIGICVLSQGNTIHARETNDDEQTTQHLCEIFQTCCLFDLRFWDMVYAMGET